MKTEPKTRFRRLVAVVAAFLVGAAGVITGPVQTAAAAVNVYTDPGHHTVNGRQWRTTCEPYTSKIDRCRAEIWATQILPNEKTGFSQTNGWVFNNLTYKAAHGSLWGTNPLANPGQFTSSGRQWRTDCNDSWTGANACRTFIKSTVITSYIDSKGNRQYKNLYDQWVFNNVVYFSPGTAPWAAGGSKPAPKPTTPATPPSGGGGGGSKLEQFAAASCTGPLPSGYRVSSKGVPYSLAAPYEPKDQANPIAIANFNGSVRSSSALSASQKKCWANKSAAQLILMSRTTTYGGKTVRWYGYPFDFSANPSTTALKRGWISGLGQGAVMGSLWGTSQLTGDQEWMKYAAETYESYFVPIDKGGFQSYKTGELWFEEYPTNPPTTVLNGMNYATVGFVNWTRHTNDQRGLDMFDDILAAYKKFLPMFNIDDEGGTLATYDLVRGMKTANPIRFVGVNGGKISTATIHGSTYRPATASLLPAAGELITNGALNGSGGWRTVGSKVAWTGGIARVTPGYSAWQGINQEIPAAKFTDRNRQVSLQFSMRRIDPAKGGNIAGKVTVFQKCLGKQTALLSSEVPRGDRWGTYTYAFKAPAAGCSMVVQFLGNSQTADGTVLEFDNISVRYADWVGAGAFTPSYDHYVWRNPTSEVKMVGSGTIALQAYVGGRWQPIVQVSLAGAGRTWTIPERFTGRNINYKYHNHHPMEMVALYKALGDPIFREYALKWDAMALGYKVS